MRNHGVWRGGPPSGTDKRIAGVPFGPNPNYPFGWIFRSVTTVE